MKNQIIKKIMAYLLVGAMVITTPMTASANELENAYATEEDEDGNPVNNSRTGTSTSTNTTTKSIDLPAYIGQYLPSIIGISLDKSSLEFGELKETNVLQARALFDTYDASAEEMQWVGENEKKAVEAEINWFSDDYSVATIGHVWNTWNGDNVIIDENGGIEKAENEDGSKTKQGNKAQIVAVGEGVTTIYAWIEADGQVYTNAPQRPTPGDFIAKATVTVKNAEVSVEFDEDAVNKIPVVYSKRQYDLKEYTYLNYGQDKVRADENDVMALTYSITGTRPSGSVKTAASITADGILKVTKGAKGGAIDILVVCENGEKATGTITLGEENPVTRIGKFKSSSQKLDLGYAGETTFDEDGDVKDIKTTIKVDIPEYTTKLSSTPTTDEFIWSSNKTAIAVVKPSEDRMSATVEAKGVGTAKITVKSSSGKSASFNVTVYATPTSVELPVGLDTYTGQTKTLTAILKGDEGQELPVGTTTLKWEIDKVTGKRDKAVANPYAKISSKKDVATVKATDFLKDPVTGSLPTVQDGAITGIAIVRITSVKYKNNTNNKSVSMDLEKLAKEPKTEVTITQSDLKDVTLAVYNNPNSNESKEIGITTNETRKTATDKTNCYVGQNYITKAAGKAEKGSLDSIAWTISGKGVNYNIDGASVITNFTSNAKTTIKASYITITDATRAKYRKLTQTINITPIQNVSTIAFVKPEVVKNVSSKDQSVTFKIGQVTPKNAKYTIDADKGGWKVLAYDGNEEVKEPEKLITKTTKNSVTIKIPKDYEVGSVIKVGAYTTSGAVAYGYIYITDQTKKVTPYVYTSESNKVNDVEGKEAGTKTGSIINLSIGQNAWLSAKLTVTGKDALQTVGQTSTFGTIGDTTSYVTEPIASYTLDKKGALCVKIDANGKIIPLQAGNATVTIKTISGKSQKAKIIVSNPAPSN